MLLKDNVIYILFDENNNFHGVYKSIENIVNYLHQFNCANFEMSIEEHGRGDLTYLHFKDKRISHYAIVTAII